MYTYGACVDINASARCTSVTGSRLCTGSYPAYYPELCPDGNDTPTNAIFHSQHEWEAWWTVELATPSCVTRIVVFNAWEHCCRERISPFKIMLQDAAGNTITEKVFTGSDAVFEWQDIDTSEVAAVKVQLDGHSNYLHFGEVEVYGFQ